MGLSRNKVAVSEGAAGSPPFYGESGFDHAEREDGSIFGNSAGRKSRTETDLGGITDERRTSEGLEHGSCCSIVSDQERRKPHLFIEKAKANPLWGCSSAGRAPALQAGGQGFDSLHLHQPTRVG